MINRREASNLKAAMRQLRRPLAACAALLLAVILPSAAAAAPDDSRAAKQAPVIAAVGDSACDPTWPEFNGGAGTDGMCAQRATSDLAASRDFDAVLMLGDAQYLTGSLSAYEAAYDPSWGRVKPITYPTPGNHDYYTEGAAGYFDYFNGVGEHSGPAGARDKGRYSLDLGAWHLISLNSNCEAIGGCGAGSAQQKWLARDLERTKEKCVLAYWHHPRFSSSLHGNNETMKHAYKRLYKAGADVILSGHDHIYERFAPQSHTGKATRKGPRAFVVGTGGLSHYPVTEIQPNSRVRDNTTFGVLRFKLKPDSYKWRFLPANGIGFSDSGKAQCV